MKRIIGAIAALFLLLPVFSACSTVSTEPDEVALHYSGGEFSSKKFQNCVDASKRERNGPGDTYYVYPKGQRTFSFTGKDGSESEPIAVTTGSQEVSVGGFLTFTLNTDCDTLREFHERIGKKYEAYKDGKDGKGWEEFLNDYIAVPLNATLNNAAGAIKTPAGASVEQNWYLLYTSDATRKEFEKYVKENLPDEIESTLGDKFITVGEVSIAKPTISKELKSSLAKKEQARLENDAQKEQNEKVRTQYDTIKDCLRTGLSEASCTLIFLSQNGAEIPFVPVPQGGNITYSGK